MIRVGILLIHGIGDQGRYQHLQNVVERFVRGLITQVGNDRVSVEMPGLAGDATIWVHHKDGDISFDFTEMWWRDLGLRPSLLTKIGFWLWAISLPGTRGYFASPGLQRYNPDSLSARSGVLTVRARLGLLLRTTGIFMLLSPAAMIVRFVNIIPGMRALPFMHSVFTYLSSVQLYQERWSSQPGTLVDYDQARRISIQRRMANIMVSMAQQDFDRWYVFGHSLGSVIALKALMYDGVAFARFMSHQRWHDRSLEPFMVAESQNPNQPAPPADELTATETLPFGYVDCPKCPAWLPHDAALDTGRLFQRLRGLVTYGSPIETFARTWPAIIQGNADVRFRPDFEWINIFDPTDVVAPKIEAFGKPGDVQPGRFVPKNVPVDSSYLVGKSHVNYFDLPKNSRPHRVIIHLLDWMRIGGAFDTAKMKHIGRRNVMLTLQGIGVLLLGGLLWPVATFSFLGFIQFLTGGVIKVISYTLTNFTLLEADRLNKVSNQLFSQARDSVLALSPSTDWVANVLHVAMIYVLIFGVVGVASGLHFVWDRITESGDEQERPVLHRKSAIRIDAAASGKISATLGK